MTRSLGGSQQGPLGFYTGDVNLYRYVSNNPTNSTDPTGLDQIVAQCVFGLDELISNLLTPRPTVTVPPISVPPGTKVGINDPVRTFRPVSDRDDKARDSWTDFHADAW